MQRPTKMWHSNKPTQFEHRLFLMKQSGEIPGEKIFVGAKTTLFSTQIVQPIFCTELKKKKIVLTSLLT